MSTAFFARAKHSARSAARNQTAREESAFLFVILLYSSVARLIQWFSASRPAEYDNSSNGSDVSATGNCIRSARATYRDDRNTDLISRGAKRDSHSSSG
ncbi:hypothetical protein D9M68_826630 [compost metagenome]